jgi:hypothetical protein
MNIPGHRSSRKNAKNCLRRGILKTKKKSNKHKGSIKKINNS